MTPPAARTAEADVYLVRGDDPSLVAQSAREVVERLVGERDPGLVVEEHGGPLADDLQIGAVIDACMTPPFLVDRRVVVLREAGRLTPADAARLAEALERPMPSTALVLVGGGGSVPQALVKAVNAKGQVIDCSVRTSAERKVWLSDHLHGAPVRLDHKAAALLSDHLGEDLGRLSGILDTLADAYGTGATVDVERLQPFLGEAGSVPPWELTDAIDEGRIDAALAVLARMTGPGGTPPPVVVAMLHRTYANLLLLSDADVRSEEEAAALMGVKPGYPARKALQRSRAAGGQRLSQALQLISQADVDSKGASGLAPSLVMEVLVARLTRLMGGGASAGAGTGGSTSRRPRRR